MIELDAVSPKRTKLSINRALGWILGQGYVGERLQYT